jgi:outer membrane protein OmpA-like peptidoglycan-associated protein/tetratricopeptide (TPR) repeat protein
MLFRRLAIFIYLTTASLSVFAQNASKLVQKAEQEFESFSYAKAIELYESALKKGKNLNEDESIHAKLKLGLSYRQVKDYQNAERVFRDALMKSPVLKGEDIKAYMYFAQVLASNGKHSEAAIYYKKFTELQEQDKRGEKFVELYTSYLDALKRNAGSYKIEYLGINSSSSDFSPTYYKKGLVFVSGRSKNSGIKRIFNWDGSAFLDLFYLEDLKALGTEENNTSAIGSGSPSSASIKPPQTQKKLGNDYYTPPTSNDSKVVGRTGNELINGNGYNEKEEQPSISTEKFSKTLNSKWHEGSCTFFHDNSKIIFTRNSQNVGGLFNQKKGVSRLKLFMAEFENNDWRKIRELPFNSNDYSCMHPTITIDDKIVYFASDMPGGYGGTDIWMTRYNNGEWSKPVNLGATVNTRGNELYPFVDERGNLYLSTDGHPGLGDLDIFFVAMNTATGLPANIVRNLGAPINSEKDDFGIITDSERKTGYFSSNRKKGGTDDDIYKFTRLGTLYGCREVVVNVYDNVTKKPFDKIRFEYELKGDASTREGIITNSKGSVKICLEADKPFVFHFKQLGFIPTSLEFSNKEASDYIPSVLNVYLKPYVYVPDKKGNNKKENSNFVDKLISKKDGNTVATIFRGIVTAGKDSTAIAGALVRFTNQCTGEVQEMTTGSDGSYEFKRDLTCDYVLEATKEKFGKSSETIEKIAEKRPIIPIISSIFKTKKKKQAENTNSLFDTRLYRVGDIVNLANIYYDSESFKLRKEATKELDKLANILKRNPNMIIEIFSHTDTRGNAQDNLFLSQKRANEVGDYLVNKEINRNRIKATGMGEKKPVNECGDGVQCTEAEHQRNRRTEFKILSIEKK